MCPSPSESKCCSINSARDGGDQSLSCSAGKRKYPAFQNASRRDSLILSNWPSRLFISGNDRRMPNDTKNDMHAGIRCWFHDAHPRLSFSCAASSSALSSGVSSGGGGIIYLCGDHRCTELRTVAAYLLNYVSVFTHSSSYVVEYMSCIRNSYPTVGRNATGGKVRDDLEFACFASSLPCQHKTKTPNSIHSQRAGPNDQI